jgi:hypothetical protein
MLRGLRHHPVALCAVGLAGLGTYTVQTTIFRRVQDAQQAMEAGRGPGNPEWLLRLTQLHEVCHSMDNLVALERASSQIWPVHESNVSSALKAAAATNERNALDFHQRTRPTQPRVATGASLARTVDSVDVRLIHNWGDDGGSMSTTGAVCVVRSSNAANASNPPNSNANADADTEAIHVTVLLPAVVSGVGVWLDMVMDALPFRFALKRRCVRMDSEVYGSNGRALSRALDRMQGPMSALLFECRMLLLRYPSRPVVFEVLGHGSGTGSAVLSAMALVHLCSMLRPSNGSSSVPDTQVRLYTVGTHKHRHPLFSFSLPSHAQTCNVFR